jgi:MFS family permease
VKITEAFPAFEDRNFRLYFTGQCSSMIGMWIQSIAQTWLVYQITGSKMWVGVIASLITLPGGFLGAFGGILLDRFHVRKILYATQSISILPPIALAVVTFAGKVTAWHIFTCAALSGIIFAIDQPGRQELICEILVDEQKRRCAISLHSTVVSAAQFVGPAIGGFILMVASPGWAFLIYALMILPALFSLWLMKLDLEPKRNGHTHPLRMLWDCVQYITSHETIFLFLALCIVFGLLQFAFRSMLPVITKDVFHKGSQVLGFLAAAPSIGAFVGTIYFAHAQKSTGFFLRSSLILTGASLVLVSKVETLHVTINQMLAVTLCLLFVAGIGFTLGINTLRVTVQNLSDRNMRGRINGFLVTTIFGGVGAGSIVMGFLAKKVGTMPAIYLNGITLLIFAAILSLPFMERRIAKA